MISNRNNSDNNKICCWIGEGECCSNTAVYRKSYCEQHYNRMYLVFLPEMADYIIDKELSSDIQNTD